MSKFKVGDRVKVVPTTRVGWNSEGLMEDTVGMVGVVRYIVGRGHHVFFDGYSHPFGRDALWSYREEDLKKHGTFKGNIK